MAFCKKCAHAHPNYLLAIQDLTRGIDDREQLDVILLDLSKGSVKGSPWQADLQSQLLWNQR